MFKYEEMPKFLQALFAVILVPIWVPVMLWAVICAIYQDEDKK